MGFNKRLLAGLVAIPLVLGAGVLQSLSFSRLEQMRQLERIPRGRVISVIEGEVNLSGVARSAGETVTSTHTNTACFYFLYTLEKKERDSDGDTHWNEVERVEQYVPFYLEDDTGRILVRPERRAKFNLERDDHSRDGDYRYQEWRLDPGDPFFTFGLARHETTRHVVTFSGAGSYIPLISQIGEAGERSKMATLSLLLSFLALVAVSFAVVFVCQVAGVHRIALFLTAVSLVQGGALTYMGLRLLRDDLTASDRRVEEHEQRARMEVASILEHAGLSKNPDWADDALFNAGLSQRLSSNEFARVRGIYGDLAAAIGRHDEVLRRFPERLLAPAFGVSQRDPLPLADEFAPDHADREIIVAAPVGNATAIVAILVGLGMSVVASLLGFRKIKEKRHIENIPTSISSGLAYGPAELKGTIEEVEELLDSPLTHQRCVYFRYLVKKLKGSGKHRKWVTVSDTTEHCRFDCVDEGGGTPVNLAGAEVHSTNYRTRREGKLKYAEWTLRPTEKLYLLGSAVIEPETGARLEIARGDSGFPFIVSNMTETALMQKKGRRGILWLNTGLNGIVLAGLALFGVTASYAATDYLGAALFAPAFLAVCVAVLMYNDLQFVRNRVQRAWANIDVSLKKRFDLIPNLQTVAGEYLAHEKSLLVEISELRNALADTAGFDPESAGKLIEQEARVVCRLLGVFEKYPKLEGHEVVGKLGDELIRLENEIALMRQGYNDSVERFNTRIGQLPELLLARLFRFEEARLFHAELEVRQPVSVFVDG